MKNKISKNANYMKINWRFLCEIAYKIILHTLGRRNAE